MRTKPYNHHLQPPSKPNMCNRLHNPFFPRIRIGYSTHSNLTTLCSKQKKYVRQVEPLPSDTEAYLDERKITQNNHTLLFHRLIFVVVANLSPLLNLLYIVCKSENTKTSLSSLDKIALVQAIPNIHSAEW